MSVSTESASGRTARRTGAAMAAAFFDDPTVIWMMPDEHSRHRRLQRFFATLHRHYFGPFGECVMVREGRTVLGAAYWAPPGAHVPDSRQMRAVPGLLLALGRRVEPASQALNYLTKRHPSEPHWYLAAIGTRPAHQGQGIGSALLRGVLQRCDEHGEPAYLESSKESNIPFYERHGFAVTEVLTPPDSATWWGMYRRPQ
jgi:GNAT superfamily N-acetyltransferase